MTQPAARRWQRPVHGWVALGALAFALLPWHFPQDRTLAQSLAAVYADPPGSAGLWLLLAHDHRWLGCAPLAWLLALLSAWARTARTQGALLVLAGGVGLLGLLGGAIALGARGWAHPALQPLGAAQGQPGLGLGGVTTIVSMLMLMAIGFARRGRFRGDAFVAGAVWFTAALLAVFVAWPVAKALSGAFVDDGGHLALAELAQRLGSERLWGLGCLGGGVRCGTAWNTLVLGLMTATGTTALGTILALLAERGPTRLRRPLNGLALLPIITPPFVVGLGLILLFGRAGLVNQALEWAFGITPTRWFYGLFGLWLAQMFAFTPIAFMIVRGVVQGVGPSLEEAAQTLRASRAATLRTITLPLIRPGLTNAFLVGFIESMADFGNPILVGGQFSVLSTDIFFAIVGAQYDQAQAATLALVLTVFALVVFVVQQRVLGRASYATVSGKGDPGLPMPLPTGVRRLCLGLALPWVGFTLVVYLFALAGGFARTWGRDYTLTLSHFRSAFDLQWSEHGLVWAGSAWASLITTVKLAAIAAPLCAVLGLTIAWILSRTRFAGRRSYEFGALLAFAIPGTVLGVSYILAFNVPPLELTGTALIIVLCFVFRNLPVGVRAGTASLQQIDRSLDEASTMLRAGTATTLRRVILPLLKPALAAALVYSFVRSMTTVSAVVFLVTAETELATTYIIGRVGNGDYGVALAYCTALIVLMSLATVAIQRGVGARELGRRAAAR